MFYVLLEKQALPDALPGAADGTPKTGADNGGAASALAPRRPGATCPHCSAAEAHLTDFPPAAAAGRAAGRQLVRATGAPAEVRVPRPWRAGAPPAGRLPRGFRGAR